MAIHNRSWTFGDRDLTFESGHWYWNAVLRFGAATKPVVPAGSESERWTEMRKASFSSTGYFFGLP